MNGNAPSVEGVGSARTSSNASAAAACVVVLGALLGLQPAAGKQFDAKWRACEIGAVATMHVQIEACTEIIAKGGQSPQRLAIAHFNRGWAYNLGGRHDRAIDDFGKAIRFEPDSANAFRSRGDAYRRKKMLTPAIVDFNRAIALKPDYAGAFSDRGAAYYALGRRIEALADFDHAIALLPDVAEPYLLRAQVLARSGDFAGAVRDLDRAIAIEASDGQAYAARGYAHLALKRPELALFDFKAALRLRPDLATARRGLKQATKAAPALRPTIANMAGP